MEAQSITVKIDNPQSDEGQILIALHTKETFMKGPGIQNVTARKEAGEVVGIFENVKPGVYAILVLHDLNSNNQMDYYPTGLPKEDYGVSNNPVSFGPPFFSDAKFELTGDDKVLNIRF